MFWTSDPKGSGRVLLILTHGFQHGLGVFGTDAEEDAGGSGGLAAALFPVAQRGGADTEGGRELRLTEVELGADGGD